MLKLAILFGLVLLATAMPRKRDELEHIQGEHAHVGHALHPWMPFPHFDGIALFPYPGKPHLTLLPGSAFVEVNPHGECHRIQLTDEAGGACPVNQTVCDIIAATPCPPSVANVTCFAAPKPGQNATAGQPTNVPEGEFGNGYPLGGPLCHVQALGRRFQPSAYTAIFTLTPKIATCVFQVAPAPTVYPEPTVEPVLPVDPPCPFIEQ